MRLVRSRVEVLSPAEIRRIHCASLNVLWEVGVQLPNEWLLARLRALGASVEGDVVHLPGALVERMLEEIGERPRGRHACAVNRGQVRVTNGNETLLLDYPSRTRRPGTLEDVLKGIVLTNALPTVAHALPVVVPADVPLPLAPIECYRLGCLYSRKPFGVYFGPAAAETLMDMAEVLAEARGLDRAASGFGFSFGVISPLRFGAEDLDCALRVAARGWPASCYSFVVVGATAPASMAGALVLSNAERLACLTLMWLWGAPGYREGHVDDPAMIEPRTLASSFGHPNLTTLAIATAQLSRFYGLRGGGALALSDAKDVDFQSGLERGLGAVFAVLAGGGIGNSGIVGADEALSLEQLVLDDAALSMLNWITRGIEVTDETLALDVIQAVGIGGDYLGQPHTARHLRREYWESPLFIRRAWADWERGGAETLLERAHAEVERILAAGYPPQPVLDAEAAARLEAIVERARATNALRR